MIQVTTNEKGLADIQLDGTPAKLIFEAGAVVARVAIVCGPLLAMTTGSSVEDATAYILRQVQRQADVRIEAADPPERQSQEQPWISSQG